MRVAGSPVPRHAQLVLARAARSLLLGVLACTTQVPEPPARTSEGVSALAALRPMASQVEELAATR
jgi:hypothetical protein